MPPEMLGRLARKRMAQSAWESIKIVCADVYHVREVNAQHLRHELSEIDFKPKESVDDFSFRVDTLTNKLCFIGDDIEESEGVKKLLLRLIILYGLTFPSRHS
jgi:hypothetical protein